MDSIISFIDIYAQKPNLYYNGHSKYNSAFSITFSIISLLIMVSICMYFFISYINGDNMNIIQTRLGKFDPKIDLKTILFHHRIIFRNLTNVPSNIIESVIYFKTLNGTSSSKEKINLTQCSFEEIYQDPKYKQMLSCNLSLYKCISKKNNKNLILSQYQSPFYISYIDLIARKCINSTENNFNCLPKEKIEEILSTTDIFLELYVENSGFDHENNSNPLIENYLMTQDIFSAEFSTYTEVYFHKLLYESNTGIIFDNKKFFESITFDFNSRSISYLALNEDYLKDWQFIPFNEYADKYTRNYPKFQSFLANAGGVINAIFYICDFCCWLLAKKFMYRDIINLLINYRKEHSINRKTICVQDKEMKGIKKENDSLNMNNPIKNDNIFRYKRPSIYKYDMNKFKNVFKSKTTLVESDELLFKFEKKITNIKWYNQLFPNCFSFDRKNKLSEILKLCENFVKTNLNAHLLLETVYLVSKNKINFTNKNRINSEPFNQSINSQNKLVDFSPKFRGSKLIRNVSKI